MLLSLHLSPSVSPSQGSLEIDSQQDLKLSGGKALDRKGPEPRKDVDKELSEDREPKRAEPAWVELNADSAKTEGQMSNSWGRRRQGQEDTSRSCGQEGPEPPTLRRLIYIQLDITAHVSSSSIVWVKEDFLFF